MTRERNHILAQAVVYTDGWVVNKSWVTRLFEEAGMQRTFFVSPLERTTGNKDLIKF